MFLKDANIKCTTYMVKAKIHIYAAICSCDPRTRTWFCERDWPIDVYMYPNDHSNFSLDSRWSSLKEVVYNSMSLFEIYNFGMWNLSKKDFASMKSSVRPFSQQTNGYLYMVPGKSPKSKFQIFEIIAPLMNMLMGNHCTLG